MVCFQETKLDHMSCRVVHGLWGFHHVDCCCLDSRRASTGISLTLDRTVVKKINERVGEFTIMCSFRKVKDHFTWAFTSVYGPNSNGARRLLWDELANFLVGGI